MNNLVMIAALFLAHAGISEGFAFNGEPYEMEKLGSKYFVYLTQREVTARDISKLTKIDCQSLEAYIDDKKEEYSVCLDDPQSTYCKLLRNDAIFMSQEELYQSPPLMHPASRRWALSTKRSQVSEAALKDFVASQFGIDHNAVEIIEPQRTKPMEPLSITFRPTSFISELAFVLPMGPGMLPRPELKGSELVVNNRFFACDFEQDRVTVGASFIATINHEESFDPDVIEFLWHLYNNIAQLMHHDDYKSASMYLKSAMIGQEIGLRLHSSRISDPRITLESIFNTWFTDDERVLILRPFDSLNAFHEDLYPNQSFAKDVTISWRSS